MADQIRASSNQVFSRSEEDLEQVDLPPPPQLATPSGAVVTVSASQSDIELSLDRLDQSTINRLLLQGLLQGYAQVSSLRTRVIAAEAEIEGLRERNLRFQTMFNLTEAARHEAEKVRAEKSAIVILANFCTALGTVALGPVGAGVGTGVGIIGSFAWQTPNPKYWISSQEQLEYINTNPDLSVEQACVSLLNKKLKEWKADLPDNSYVPDEARTAEYLVNHPGSTRYDAHYHLALQLLPAEPTHDELPEESWRTWDHGVDIEGISSPDFPDLK